MAKVLWCFRSCSYIISKQIAAIASCTPIAEKAVDRAAAKIDRADKLEQDVHRLNALPKSSARVEVPAARRILLRAMRFGESSST
jgi:hypothetical protein